MDTDPRANTAGTLQSSVSVLNAAEQVSSNLRSLEGRYDQSHPGCRLPIVSNPGYKPGRYKSIRCRKCPQFPACDGVRNRRCLISVDLLHSPVINSSHNSVSQDLTRLILWACNSSQAMEIQMSIPAGRWAPYEERGVVNDLGWRAGRAGHPAQRRGAGQIGIR